MIDYPFNGWNILKVLQDIAKKMVGRKLWMYSFPTDGTQSSGTEDGDFLQRKKQL